MPGPHGASKPRPKPPIYDDEFAKRAEEAARQARERKNGGR